MKKKLAIIIVAVATFALALALTGCGQSADEGSGSQQQEQQPGSEQQADPSASSQEQGGAEEQQPAAPAQGYTSEASGPYASGHHSVLVKVKDFGEFTISLDADAAPVTVSNFMTLVEKGYYNGLAFYRAQDGFVLQGGTAGNSASGQDSSIVPIVGEFSGNGIDNALADAFERGTVAMARTSDPNSAGSTFFITLATSEDVSNALNGQYAAFGMVDPSQMDVVDSIVAKCLSCDADQMGCLVNESDMPIIESITIVD